MADDIQALSSERERARYNWRLVAAMLLNAVLWGALLAGFVWLTRH